LKIVQNCSDEEQCVMWCDQPWSDIFCDVWNAVEVHLQHPHSWVQLVSVQLFNAMFEACPPDQTIAQYLAHSKLSFQSKVLGSQKTLSRSNAYLSLDLPRKLHILSGSFCSQLSSTNVSEQLANEIVCSLLHVARMIKELPQPVSAANNDDEDDKRTSLTWLLRRLTREIRKETSGVDKSTIKRKAIYRWLHGLGKILGPDIILTYLKPILQPLVREMTSRSPNVDSELKVICQETMAGIKDITGSDAFSREYAAIQQAVGKQRQQRKVDRHIQVWTESLCSSSCCEHHQSSFKYHVSLYFGHGNVCDFTISCKRFLANSERELCCHPSICRLSVCRLSSVTLVHPTQAVVIFRNISTALGTLAIR